MKWNSNSKLELRSAISAQVQIIWTQCEGEKHHLIPQEAQKPVVKLDAIAHLCIQQPKAITASIAWKEQFDDRSIVKF